MTHNALFDGLEGSFAGLEAKREGMALKFEGMRVEMAGLIVEIRRLSMMVDGLAHRLPSDLSLMTPFVADVRKLRQELEITQRVLSQKEPLGFSRLPKT